MKIGYKLYLDDLRMPKTLGPWVIARSFDEAVGVVKERGFPIYCSFDHDLGEEKTGYDFAKWLVEYELDEHDWFHDDFDFNVHSANPVGERAIIQYLNNYFSVRALTRIIGDGV